MKFQEGQFYETLYAKVIYKIISKSIVREEVLVRRLEDCEEKEFPLYYFYRATKLIANSEEELKLYLLKESLNA